MYVIVTVEEGAEQFKPHKRTRLPVDDDGFCWKAGIRLQIDSRFSFSHVGYHPQGEKILLVAVKGALQACPLIKGGIELDMTSLNGQISLQQCENLMREFACE